MAHGNELPCGLLNRQLEYSGMEVRITVLSEQSYWQLSQDTRPTKLHRYGGVVLSSLLLISLARLL